VLGGGSTAVFVLVRLHLMYSTTIILHKYNRIYIKTTSQMPFCMHPASSLFYFPKPNSLQAQPAQ